MDIMDMDMDKQQASLEYTLQTSSLLCLMNIAIEWCA